MININLFIKKQSTTKKVKSLLEESLISLCLNLVLPAVNFYFFHFFFPSPECPERYIYLSIWNYSGISDRDTNRTGNHVIYL